MASTQVLVRTARWLARGLWPNERLRLTREGWGYFAIWLGLMAMGVYQQINMLLLVAGIAAGPLAASLFVGGPMLRSLRASRRTPSYLFSGEPMAFDYTLENGRRWLPALALSLDETLVPVDRSISGWASVNPRLFFARVPGRAKARLRWQGVAPARGRHRFASLELVTRAPFGLVERRIAHEVPGTVLVYPAVGRLTRAWPMRVRQASQTRRGRRHDRSAQQQEYHGLRDYRPGDSPRWIHWRTTARLGRPMIKEFEQQHEQDLAVLIDPWLPRNRASAEEREAVEEVIRFASTVCLETCRRQGRRILLGWTGPSPGVRHGPASVKLLHELLEQLAMLRPSSEGRLATLLDAVPAPILREATIVIVSTRPVNLAEEVEQSSRLSATSWRGLSAGRLVILNALKGDLKDYIRQGDGTTGLGRDAGSKADARQLDARGDEAGSDGTPEASAGEGGSAA